MRLLVAMMSAALVAGCGGSEPGGEGGEGNAAGAEITMDLPPPLPAEPAAPGFSRPGEFSAKTKAQPKAAEPAPAPAPPPAATAAAEPVATGSLTPSRPPIAQDGLAGYIRGAGFECDTVVATSRARSGVYKFDCANGGSYRGTMKRNHLYFRPWTGA